MRSLPIIDLNETREPNSARLVKIDERRSFKAAVVHALRIILIALFLIGLHRYAASANRLSLSEQSQWERIKIAQFLPEALALEQIQGEDSIRRAVATDGRSLALVAISSPMADHVIGYSGPTSLLFIMDEDRAIQKVQVLHSFDTPEHLQQVVNDSRFWQQFLGQRWGQANALKIDGVSGATLTSLAIAESVLTCLSSSQPLQEKSPPRRSLKFPDELIEEEQQTWVLRTGPLSDDISGYQGPTELLFRIDENEQLIDVKIRSSFDNEPYVGYTRQERSFWKKFKGRTLAELAKLDLDAEQIDGVSGATMTSIAVAKTIRDASKEHLALAQQAAMNTDVTADEKSVSRAPRWNFSIGENITIMLTIAGIFWSGSKLRGQRRLRLLWQITSFVVIALVSGNLLSISLVSGWTRGGISYRLAPGLTLLLAVAFTMAILLKRNVYCDHLCPHGILQQWIRPTGQKQRGPVAAALCRLLTSKKCVRLISIIAWVSIAIGFISLIQPTGINLSWLEPFDAYLLGFGFSVSAIVWISSLIAARLSPLYYCRHACPTGKILGYVRRDSQRNRLGLIDATVFIATCWIWLSLASGNFVVMW